MTVKSFFIATTIAIASVFSPATHAAFIASTNVPVTICDRCTVESTLNVSTHMVIGDIEVLINNLQHTYNGDLKISIFAPTGTEVLLFDGKGGALVKILSTLYSMTKRVRQSAWVESQPRLPGHSYLTKYFLR